MHGGLLQALKPYLQLAAAAFLAGFLSYAGLEGRPASSEAAPLAPPRVAAPMSDDWNLPKHI